MARVLVVDDEKSIRFTLDAFLRSAGHEVETAEDATKAEALVHAKAFDVVITDIIMPGTSGVALLEKVRAVSPDTQVILMTGEPTVETATEAVRNGAVDYLAKPFNKHATLRAISNAIRIKGLQDDKRALEESNRKYLENLEQLVAERTTALREREGRLQHILNGSIQAITAAVEIRDPYTAGHEVRVADLACVIARQMELSEHQIYGIQIAAFVHDLGKIAVPSEILTKPGKLNDFEFGLIKSHPQIGYDILKRIEFTWPVAQATLQHHERMDGSGYPNATKGEGIILEARIIAIADVVEAMSSHRPYRPARGKVAALEEIQKYSGTLYDAKIVDTCCQVIRDGLFKLE